jgi:hypothetical protein
MLSGLGQPLGQTQFDSNSQTTTHLEHDHGEEDPDLSFESAPELLKQAQEY